MRKIMIRIELILLLLLGAPLLVNAQLLKNGFETTYEVEHNSIYLGETVRNLYRQGNGQWEYVSVTEAKGLARAFIKDRIVERSVLAINPSGIQPLSYSYDQSGGKHQRKFRLDYNWDNKILQNTYLNKDFELVTGTQDLLSFLLQLMVELQHNKQIIEFHIADKKRLAGYQLKVIANETIETPYKTLPTIVLLSNKIKDKMQFKVWCAPSLQYLPIRIQKIEDDGDEDTLSLKQLKIYTRSENPR